MSLIVISLFLFPFTIQKTAFDAIDEYFDVPDETPEKHVDIQPQESIEDESEFEFEEYDFDDEEFDLDIDMIEKDEDSFFHILLAQLFDEEEEEEIDPFLLEQLESQ
ncbi:uncharacterized protein MONOS_10411 [Monocercomonoides exilis]|uniref:uncharacterized protein n=1 Tax=Monocercomonoides exilis TaxID=2049356 RepID=UPI00355A7320|nr:hypothetical protein MONOS_10411 [Monocercomonoides exilis]|eukprot:MONOS_10411.1-p1 / transcript=MONOS_10411.1 / gene=MONOS_10411 / organism=Monocercomonoides_exilis_PA203 / gene_product=unspecified product / transcript_product=unspecified product / location=Mono_scaffold00473:23446-23766(+) / protein_length=107 / sequence_SO=supercontig / SO=protein_coding / is_pseudo=false